MIYKYIVSTNYHCLAIFLYISMDALSLHCFKVTDGTLQGTFPKFQVYNSKSFDAAVTKAIDR